MFSLQSTIFSNIFPRNLTLFQCFRTKTHAFQMFWGQYQILFEYFCTNTIVLKCFRYQYDISKYFGYEHDTLERIAEIIYFWIVLGTDSKHSKKCSVCTSNIRRVFNFGWKLYVIFVQIIRKVLYSNSILSECFGYKYDTIWMFWLQIWYFSNVCVDIQYFLIVFSRN